MQRSPAVHVAFALAVASAPACRPAARPATDDAASVSSPARLSPADKAAIHSTDSTFAAAANAGDLDGVVGVYASEASLLPPNTPALEGTGPIREFWGGLFDAYQVKFELETVEIDGRGDLAYVVGRYRLTGTPKTKGPPPLDDRGKFVEILKRQADGSWKYTVDIYNSDVPPS